MNKGHQAQATGISERLPQSLKEKTKETDQPPHLAPRSNNQATNFFRQFLQKRSCGQPEIEAGPLGGHDIQERSKFRGFTAVTNLKPGNA